MVTETRSFHGQRALFFGKSMSRSRCTRGLVEALRAHGLAVKWLNRATLRRWLGARGADAWIRRTMRSYRPDLVFVFWRDLPIELLSDFKAHALTALWVEESLPDIGEPELEYLRTPHLVAMSNLGHIDYLRERGIDNAVFQRAAFSPTAHYPVRPRGERFDVGYIGGAGRRGQRVALLARLSERFDVRVFGPAWGTWRQRFPNLRAGGAFGPRGYRRTCANARVVLGLNEVNQVPYYYSNRIYLTLGCGAFHLTHYVPGMEEVFQDGEHLAYFDTPEECEEKLAFYLPREDLRRRIAAKGHELVTREHRYHDRMAAILTFLREGRDADRITGPSLEKARVLAGRHPLSATPGLP